MSDLNKNSSTLKKIKKNFRQPQKTYHLDVDSNSNLTTTSSLSEQCIANLKHADGTIRKSSLSISDTALYTSSNSPLPRVERMNYKPTYGSTLSLDMIPPFILHRSAPNTSSEVLKINNTDNALQQNKSWHHLWLIFYSLFYVGFLLFGCVGFQLLEIPTELEIRASIRERVDKFLLKYPQIADADLEDFLQAVITANDRGISPLRNASNEMNWSFGQALFFSSTVLTTIGYGHVTPLSQTGKIFCMIYATIGIPLTLVLITAVVERLLIPTNWFLGVLNSKLGHLYQPFNIRLLHLSIIVILILIIFFAIPTTIFACLEPAWGILDAFYYCFISLTTIGLGDYIPGDGVSAENHSFYKICITCYLIFGLIAMMLVLTIFYDIPQLNLGQLFTESVNGESEKLRLSANNATCYSGTSGLYMPQPDDDNRRAIVRIRPHGTDSPSPEDTPTLTSRDRRIP